MATIQVVTHHDPYVESAPAGREWDRDPAVAAEWYRRFCREFPEHLVRRYRRAVDPAASDQEIAALVDGPFTSAANEVTFGEIVHERPAVPAERRMRMVTIDLTEEQFEAVRRLDPTGSIRMSPDSGFVYLISINADTLTEHRIAEDGTYATYRPGLEK